MVNAHRYGNIFEKMLQLRHKGFIVEEKYEVRDYNGLEFDQYDDPYAHYVVITKNDEVVACSRIRRVDVVHQVPNVTKGGENISTNITYMARDLWINQIPEECLTAGVNHYEFTRVYADSSLPMRERTKLTAIIISASYIYMLSIGGISFSFVTHKTLFNMVNNLGMDVSFSCDISIPNFSNLQYAGVGLLYEDAWRIISTLYNKTAIDIQNFALECGLRIDGDLQKAA
jgi:hypothetical protein